MPGLAERVLELPGEPMQRGDQISLLATFGALRFPKVNMWDLLRRSTMLSELMDELVEDSPFLRQLRDESVAEGDKRGQVKEAQAMLRQMALARVPTLTESDLAPIGAVTTLERLHALVLVLMGISDADAFRRALRDAQA